MKTWVVLLLAAVGGYYGYKHFIQTEESAFGISKEAPLGSFETLDQSLTGMGLAKEGPKASEHGETHNAYFYRDKEWMAKSSVSQSVMIYVDSSGKMVGVGAVYTRKEALGSPKVAEFISKMWKEYSQAPLQFASETTGEGLSARTFQTAKFTKDNVEGKWMKDEGWGEFVQIMLK